MYQKNQSPEMRDILRELRKQEIEPEVIIGRICRKYGNGGRRYGGLSETEDQVFIDLSQSTCVTCATYTECMLATSASPLFKSNNCLLHHKMQLLENSSTSLDTKLAILEAVSTEADLEIYINKYRQGLPSLIDSFSTILKHGLDKHKTRVIKMLFKFIPESSYIRSHLLLRSTGELYPEVLDEQDCVELLKTATKLIIESKPEHWESSNFLTRMFILDIVLTAEVHGLLKESQSFMRTTYVKIPKLPEAKFMYELQQKIVQNRSGKVVERPVSPELFEAVQELAEHKCTRRGIDYVIDATTSDLLHTDTLALVLNVFKKRIISLIPMPHPEFGNNVSYTAELDPADQYLRVLTTILERRRRYEKVVEDQADPVTYHRIDKDKHNKIEEYIQKQLPELLDLVSVILQPMKVVYSKGVDKDTY